MSKTLSYRGTLAIGLEDRIRLKTLKGKVGYKITKFQLMSTLPQDGIQELIGKITKVPDTNIGAIVDFTNSDLMAATVHSTYSGGTINSTYVIFDNEITNQDIFVNITDGASGTTPCNYYIELEVMDLSDIQSTQLTLKSIKQITSRA